MKNVLIVILLVLSSYGTSVASSTPTRVNANYITADDVGSQVEVIARVVSKYLHPKGHLFLTVSVVGTDQELEVRVFNISPPYGELIDTGATIRIQGKVSTYKGQLQIIPESESHIDVLDQSEVKVPALIPIGDITKQNRGETFQVKVFVESLAEHDSNAFMTLMDVSTQQKINAVLFRADAEEIIGRKIKLIEAQKNGIPVRLLVLVNIYNNELQLIIDKVYNNFN